MITIKVEMEIAKLLKQKGVAAEVNINKKIDILLKYIQKMMYKIKILKIY